MKNTIAKRFSSLLSDDNNLKIETTRLILEPTVESHAENMFIILQDQSLYQFIPQKPPTLEELRNRYRIWSRRVSPNESEIWLNWVAFERISGEPIGQFQAGFDDKNGFSVAYTIAKLHQKQGYATEGMKGIIEFLRLKMQAQSIKAWVDTRNTPSIALMNRLGFKKIAFIENADEFKGSKSDEFVFELTKQLVPALKKHYYAVIFSSIRNQNGNKDYEAMAEKMVDLAKKQKGFLGVESARDPDGFGITISYWESEDDIKAWKANGEHQHAQELGRMQWYESYVTRICKIERDYAKI